MVLYLNMFLGHVLGDFVLQPGRLVMAKRNRLAGLLGHVAVVAACTAAVLVSDLASLWRVVAYVAAAHLLIEVVTIHARRGRAARGLFVFGLDQALHLASLVPPVLMLGTEVSVKPATFGYQLDVARLAAVTAMATVVFFGSILVFEASETAEARDEPLLPLDAARLLGMVERGTSLGAALLAGPALLALPFLPRTLAALRLQPRDRLRQVTIAVSGLLLCAAAYAFVAAVAAAVSLGYL
ncbi:MAG: DUF3307 domain-containing protein [Coriobacteriia bacterium]|nr:DUF3307 domain-containing protein [Coriobacteriia bacterium]